MSYRSSSWGQRLGLAFTLLVKIPITVTLDLGRKILLERQTTGLLKATSISFARAMTSIPYQRVRPIAGSSRETYVAWAKREGLPAIVEADLIGEAELYWIGPKRTDKVVLFVHGGAFVYSLAHSTLKYWSYVKKELEKQGIEAGFAILGYGLSPEQKFPAQLRQLAVAIDHLLAAGTLPHNIHLVGESAGGNIIMQFLSHLLHPIDGIGPVQTIKAPFGGVYLMSPWLTFKSTSPSFVNPNTKDVVTRENLVLWGREYSQDVPDSMLPYVEPARAGPTWFSGLGLIVKRMLISAGSGELLRDDIIAFGDNLRNNGGVDVQLEVQEGGLHADPPFDFFVFSNPSSVGDLTPVIIEWLKEQLTL